MAQLEKRRHEPRPNNILFEKRISNYSIVGLSTNSWVFNQDIVQYSSTATLMPSNGYLNIETLLFFTDKKSVHHLSQTAKCVVVLNQNRVIVVERSEAILMDSYRVNDELFKVTCTLSKEQHMSKFNEIFVGIIESYRHVSQITSGIFYVNKASFYDLSVPRIRGVVNCVHTVRNVNNKLYDHMRTWLKINQAIGMSQVKMCTVEYKSSFITKLQKEFLGFVQVNEFELSLEVICKNFKHLSPRICQPSGEGSNRIKSTSHFGRANNFHEKICTNECLMNYRYSYEYLSNYDVDEVIFPRNFQTNFQEDVLKQSSDASCKQIYSKHEERMHSHCLKYDIYDYVTRLQRMYGPYVSSFSFNHFQMLAQYDEFMKKIDSTSMFESNSENTLVYTSKKDTQVEFLIPKKSTYYFSLLKKLTNLTRCLNRTFLTSSRAMLNYKWTNVMAAPFRNRLGKSIYNCNMTMSINQHGANLVALGTYKASVDHEFGFVSHFRSDDTSQASQEPITNLKFDIENMFFLINSFQKV
jgi:hypothetical protein